jgi:hypothetical protein
MVQFLGPVVQTQLVLTNELQKFIESNEQIACWKIDNYNILFSSSI